MEGEGEGKGSPLLELKERQLVVLPAELVGLCQEGEQLCLDPLALGAEGGQLPGWEKPLWGFGGDRMSPQRPHSAHLAAPAGGGVLGGAAFPPEFPGGVVELGEDGLGEAGVPPGQLEQEPGAGSQSSGEFSLWALLRAGWSSLLLASLCSPWGHKFLRGD